MSIILKGIDLPDKKLMEMFESDNHICIGGNYYPLMIKDVIQIPKGHGRLIDGDETQAILIEEAYSGEYTERFPLGSTIKWTPTEAQRIINDNAPTILEAEEE